MLELPVALDVPVLDSLVALLVLVLELPVARLVLQPPVVVLVLSNLVVVSKEQIVLWKSLSPDGSHCYTCCNMH